MAGQTSNKYGVRVKIGVAADTGTSLKKQIEDALKGKKIELSNISVNSSSLIKSINETLGNGDFKITIKSIDATGAVKELKKQISDAVGKVPIVQKQINAAVKKTGGAGSSPGGRKSSSTRQISVDEKMLSSMASYVNSLSKDAAKLSDEGKRIGYLNKIRDIQEHINSIQKDGVSDIIKERDVISSEIAELKKKMSLAVATEKAVERAAASVAGAGVKSNLNATSPEATIKKMLDTAGLGERSLFKDIKDNAEAVNIARDNIRALTDEIIRYKTENMTMPDDKIAEHFKDKIDAIKSYVKSVETSDLHNIEKYQGRMTTLLSKNGLGRSVLNKLDKIKDFDPEHIAKIRKEYDDLVKSMAEYALQNKSFTNGEVLEHFKGNVSSLIGNISSISDAYKEELELQKAVDSRRKAETEFVNRYGPAGGLLGKTGDLLGTLGGAFAGYKAFRASITVFKKMADAVIKVNDAMTELRKVTDLTEISYSKILSDASLMARDTGTLLPDAVNSIADFSRLGYDVIDASAFARSALVYKNVGDGIDNIATATESLISTVKAFDIEAEDSIRIVDMFNAVGNNFAISSGGIGEALRRSAAALHASGNTIEESIGLVTAMNSVVQNPEQVGTALKTLTMYLRAAKTEAQDAGIETEGMAVSVSKLRDDLISLTGVDIMLDEDTFKSTYQIIKELSAVWGNLTDITKANVLSKISGKRNSNVVSSLIQNFADAEKAAKVAAESEGSAIEENEKYLDSITGKLNTFKASVQQLSVSVISSDFLKFFIDVGTALTQVLDYLGRIKVLLPTIGVLSAVVAKHLSKIRLDRSMSIFESMVSDYKEDPSKKALNILRKGMLNKSFLMSRRNMARFRDSIVDMMRDESIFSEDDIAFITGSPIFDNIDKKLDKSQGHVKSFFGKMSTYLKEASKSWTFYAAVADIALVTIGTAIDAHNRKIQESIEKANELTKSFYSADKDYRNNTDKLNSMRDRFSLLSKGIDRASGENRNLTNSEYREYLSILDDIIEISPDVVIGYDSQGRAIVDYKNVLDEAIVSQERFNDNSKDIFLNSAPNIFSGKTNQIDQFMDSLKMGNGYKEMIKSLNSYDYLSSGHIDAGIEQSFIDYVAKSIGIIEDYESITEEWLRDADNVGKLYDARTQFITALRNINSGKDGIAAIYGGEAGRFKGVFSDTEIYDYEKHIASIGAEVTQIASIRNELASVFVSVSDAQGELNDVPISALGDFKNGLLDIIDVNDSYANNLLRVTAFTQKFAREITLASNVITPSGNTFKEWADSINTVGEGALSEEGFTNQLKLYQEAVAGYINTITDPTIKKITSDWLLGLVNSESSAGSGIGDAVGSLTGLSKAMKSAADGYDLLNKASIEQSKNGRLSSETISEIAGALDDTENISDYLIYENGIIKLNSEAWEARSKAILESDKAALEAELSAVEAERKKYLKDTPEEDTRVDVIDSYDARISQLTNSINIYTNAISNAENPTIRAKTAASQLSEALGTLNDSASDIGETTQITYDKYASLIEIDRRYASAVEYQNGVMVLNKSRHAEITKTILEETSALAENEKNLILQSEEYKNLREQWEAGTLTDASDIQKLLDYEVNIQGFNTLTHEIDNATSAYERWLNRSGDTGNDRYSQALKAFELINNTLNKKDSEYYGRVGREEFGQAVDFVIGEHVDVNTEEFDRAFKVVKRYMTEDAKGATAFYDDLVKHGLLDGTTGVLNATIEEISSALGISEEMVRTMIDRLNEYQEDGSKITVTEPTVEVEGGDGDRQSVIEQLVADLGEAQQSIDEISSSEINLNFNNREQVISDLQTVDESLNSIIENKDAIGKAIGSVDSTVLNSISIHLQNAETAIKTINQEKLNLNTGNAEDSVAAIESAVHTLAVSLRAVDYTLGNSIPNEIDSVNGKELTIETENTVSRLGNVFFSLTAIVNKLDQIRRNNSITVSINEVTTKSTRYVGGSSSKTSAGGGASAYGGMVPGGKTLVGELGRETVVDPEKGIWYTVGDKGAEFVDLPKNAIVFDHLQTQDLLGMGATGERGFALASGNAAAVPRRPITVPGSDVVSGSGIKRPGSSSSSSSKKKHSSSSSSSHSHHHHHSSSSSHKSSSTFESLLKKYQELTDQTEHLIEHQEFLYEQGKRGLDYSKMEQSLQEQTKLYKKIMTDAQAGIAALTAKGAKDTDKELQEMERIYWEAYKNLYGTLDEINKLYVDGLNEKIDGIQDAYSDLAKASKEYNDYGGVTIDTLQNIVGNGLQYMSLLKNENGQFVINEDAIQKLIAAEKEQLAIETALSYLNQVKLALGNEDKNLVENLVDLSNKLSESTWDAVYAQAALLKGAGLTDDQFKKIVANIDAFRAISGSALTDISKDVDKVAGDRDKINSDQKDALDEILSLTEDLIKAETEDRIDAIEDEIDAYKEIIDLKKESLQTTKDEDDYQKNVAEKIKEIAELQRRIDQLKLDDSREARAERAKLEEELSGLQGELGEIQSDHSLDKQLETLDKTAEEYEENRQKEIDALEDSISSAEKLYQLSIDRIKNGWDTLYEDLIKWNTESGSSLNSEITENWEKAAEAVKKYGSFLEALNKLDKDKGGSSSGSGSNTIVGEGELTNPDTLNPPKPVEPDKPAPEEKPKKVKIVRGTWNVRTGASTKYHSVGYAREGQVYDYAGETLGDWLAIIYKGEKRWMHKGGSKLYDALPTYHRGGVVGKAGAINDKEVVAVLEKDELVLDKKKKNALYKAIDFHKFLSEKLGAVSGSLSMSGLHLAPAFAGAMRQVSGTTNIGNIVFNVDVNGVGDVSSTNATAFGKKIASSAMDELYDAFQRRGIGHIFGTKLKK